MRLPICLALVCLLVHRAYTQSMSCYVPADIMILLDGSDSIKDRDWMKMKEFVQQLITNFDIARDAIHLGMVVYSTQIRDHIGLNSFKDKNMLSLLAGALNHPKASTNTARGLEYVRERFEADGRPGVPKIAIVITDGSSDNPRATKMQANLAKMQGIKVLAVGVGGNMFRDELRSIASKPSKVFTSPTFGTLVTLVSEIRQMVCQVITTTTTTTTTPIMPTIPPIIVPEEKGRICDVPGDIVFLMDGSDSIGDQDFIRQKAFVANMIDNFEISSEAIHVGMIVYSTMIGETVGLQPPKNKALLKILAKSLKHPKIGTNTARGIQRVRKMMAEEGRASAPKLAVVITDGRSTNPAQTIQQANMAKMEGITMLAIGVGTEIFRDELRQMASSPRQVFEVSDFRNLGQIVTAMRDLICQEIKTTTAAPVTTDLPTPPPTYVPPPPGLICNVPADIGILLDGSDSIDDRNFKREKNFAANLINNLDIGPDTIHTSVIVYSTLIGETIPFIPFKPKTLLKILTRNLKQPKVGTNTARGISKMREYFRVQGRANAPKVMIIVTDGRSRSPSQTIQEARLAKMEGIVMIAVGVGTQIFRDELTQIATNSKKYFEVSDFAALQQIIVAIRDLICQVITTTPPVITTTPLPPTTTLHPIEGCDVPAEIMLMLQGSQSADSQNWDETKAFTTSLMRNMYVGPRSHHFGVFVYGQFVGDHIGLEPYMDKFKLENYINGLQKAKAGSNAAEGLKYMREVFRQQGRPSAPKIGVIITNDKSSTPKLSMAESDLAKTEGVKLFTVGIGNNVNRRELMEMSSGGKKMFLTPNTVGLSNIMPNLRHLICEEIKKPPPVITTPKPDLTHNFTSLCAGCLYDKGTGFNFFPGDCGMYVQCWEQAGYVRGVIKHCPFGQFWKQDELACKQSIHVHCPMDPCLHAPNGFTYGMKDKGCRGNWVCLNSHSIGSCCPEGTHYVEGMGCMRGKACKEPCPPDGGRIFTPCNKEPSWDERYFIDSEPQLGKIVRRCSPGTVFSKEYCMCVPNIDGLIPVLPGDQCRASAYFPFDVDLKDKSGSKTAVTYTNVRLTPYGTAHFTGRNSGFNLYKYAGARFGNQLFISLKFKFDRWSDSFDYGGMVVDMGTGETHWRYDIQSGWTRNITVGGGWNAEKLTRMFRKLMGATTAEQMNLHMIEIANSPDFKALLYHIGFMPEATNGLQILRILFSGEGSYLIKQILQQLGNVRGSAEIRKLLFNLLRIEGMNKWIKDHTGRHHDHSMTNWQRFLNSLTINDIDWNRGRIRGFDIDRDRIKLIADLWRIFVEGHGMDTRDWRNVLRITFDKNRQRPLGIEFLNEIEGVLGRNNTIRDLWIDFLRRRNVSVSAQFPTGHAHPSGFTKWLEQIIRSGKGGELLLHLLGGGSTGYTSTHGGFTPTGLNNIADLWREYVTDTRLDQDGSMKGLLKWTHGGGGLGGHKTTLLVEEMRNALANDNIRNNFLNFLRKHDIRVIGTENGWEMVKGGNRDDTAAWLYWLFYRSNNNQQGGQNGYDWWRILYGNDWIFGPGGWRNGGRIGITSNGLKTLADLWRLFISESALDRNVFGDSLFWTMRSGNSGKSDYLLLLREMKHILSNDGMLNRWIEFLTKHNYNIVLNNNGWDVVKGGKRNDIASFMYWLFTTVEEIESSGPGTNFDWIFSTSRIVITKNGLKTLADLWTLFIAESNLDVSMWGDVLFWTLRQNKGGVLGKNDYILLLREMRHVLSDNFMRNRWMEFLMKHNYNIILTKSGWDVVKGGSRNDIAEFIYWLFTTVDEIENSPSGSSFDWIFNFFGLDNNWKIGLTANGLKVLTDLWRMFIGESGLDKNTWGDVLFWTLRTPGTGTGHADHILLLREMRQVCAESSMRNKWQNFLHRHNYNIVLTDNGWDVIKGGTRNDFSAFMYWLFITVDMIENAAAGTNFDWIFNTKIHWDQYSRKGFILSGLKTLASLWDRFISEIHIDTNTWGHALFWTLRNQRNGQSTYQQYILLLREMRHLLADNNIRDRFIDFLQMHNYNIILTTYGWDVVLGGSQDDLPGFIYWLVTTVDFIETAETGTIISWLFVDRSTNSGKIPLEYTFTSRGIFSLSKLWQMFLTENNINLRKWRNYLVWTMRNKKGVQGMDYTLLLREMQQLLRNIPIRRQWFGFLRRHRISIILTKHGWDVVKGGGTNNVSSFMHWLLDIFMKTKTSYLPWRIHGRIPFSLRGIESLAKYWRNFIAKLHLDKSQWRKILVWTYCRSQKRNYVLLLKEMRRVLAHERLRNKWLTCMRSRNIHVVLTNDGWDLSRVGYKYDNLLWIQWLFNTIDDLESTSSAHKSYKWLINGKGSSEWFIGGNAQNGFFIGPVLWKSTTGNYWVFDGKKWEKRPLIGQTTGGRFGIHFGFAKNAIRKLSKLWNTFITDLKLQNRILNKILSWSLQDKVFKHSGENYIILIIEMQNTLSNKTYRDQWLQFLNLRNISLSLTKNGWDVIYDDDHAVDNNEWVDWLLRFTMASSGTDSGSSGSSENGRPFNIHGHRINSVFGDGWSTTMFAGPSGSSSTGSSSTESLDAILRSISTGFTGAGSSSSAQDSTEHFATFDFMGNSGQWGSGTSDLLGLLSADELFRKKRSAADDNRRRKRQARSQYQSLVGNCQNNRPSIDIAANDRNVKMSLVTDRSSRPAELVLPVVQGWNEVTLVYDGRNMRGMVHNWKGLQQTQVPLSGKVESRAEGISIGSCDKYDKLHGQVDDFVLYECIPQAIKNKFGGS